MQARELQFHIQCLPGQVGRYCFLPVAPGRCGEIAKYLDEPVHIQSNRGDVTYTGTLLGEPVSVGRASVRGGSGAGPAAAGFRDRSPRHALRACRARGPESAGISGIFA